jgi:hypothetical protein
MVCGPHTPRAQSAVPRYVVLAGTTSLHGPGAGGLGNASAAAAGIEASGSVHDDLELSFDGINLLDHRLADGGQTFTVEPPNPGVCVGNGYVLATVNTSLRVYNDGGHPLVPTTSLNTFYGYPPARTLAGEIGPEISDPSCLFDPQTARWFHLVITMERVGVSIDESGVNHLDLAVSQSSDPLGAWNIYRLPAQNDGTDGTPNHHCAGGPCLGDFPHMGLDANGVYITTNEFPFFGRGFPVAQIYALSKAQLVAGQPLVAMTQIDTSGYLLEGHAGFTVWGATTPTAHYATGQGGIEYFLSSDSVFNADRRSERLRIWALSNTQSLNTVPALTLTTGVVDVEPYSWGSAAQQREGDAPLADCISDRTMETPLGSGCWRFLLPSRPRKENENRAVNGQDSRIGQVMYADGKLWTALTTGITVGGNAQQGLAYFVLEPHVSGTNVGASVVKQGYVALKHADLTYPAVGVTADGRGVLGFSLMGKDFYPSSAYATLDAIHGAGEIHLAAEGKGPEDGLTAYAAFNDGERNPARWGDWSTAAVDGDRVWIVTEYIAQTCTFEEYKALGGRCGATFAADGSIQGGNRIATGNWATRISRIAP